MQISFDKIANALYFKFSYEKVKDTEEIDDGKIIYYGEIDDIVNIEVLNYKDGKINLNKFFK